jgi:hypothetical protein
MLPYCFQNLLVKWCYFTRSKSASAMNCGHLIVLGELCAVICLRINFLSGFRVESSENSSWVSSVKQWNMIVMCFHFLTHKAAWPLGLLVILSFRSFRRRLFRRRSFRRGSFRRGVISSWVISSCALKNLWIPLLNFFDSWKTSLM